MPPGSGLPLDAFDLSPDEVAERFRRARRSGLPRWLWPDLPPADWRAALGEIVRATGEVLAGRAARLDPEGAVGRDALSVAAYTSGMGPLLGWWTERGALSARPDHAALLALHLSHGRARYETMRGAMDRALAILSGAGVAAIVVKGMHTAAALFPDPGTRPMADVDLVIDPARVPDAERALVDAGYRRLRGDYERRPYHADWRAPGDPDVVRSLMLNHRDNPITINLRDGFDRRSALSPILLGRPGAGDTAPLAGTPARALTGPFLVAHLAAHAAEQRENLLLVRLVELVFAFRAGIDPAAVADFLHARGIAHHLYPSLALAERLAPGTLGPELAALLDEAAGPRLRRSIAEMALSDIQRVDRPVAGGRGLAARGAGDRVRAALHWLVPHASPARLADVYRRRLARIIPGLAGD